MKTTELRQNPKLPITNEKKAKTTLTKDEETKTFCKKKYFFQNKSKFNSIPCNAFLFNICTGILIIPDNYFDCNYYYDFE